MNYDMKDQIDADELKQRIEHHLSYTLGDFDRQTATINKRAWWEAICMAVNDTVFIKLKETQERHAKDNVRRIYYFSLEYLLGRLTTNNLNNLGLFEAMRDALSSMDVEIGDLLEEAPDMALGNGGLGRLAACFIDSLATLDYPAIAYGIHYENGFFKQEIEDGRQVERPDIWRDFGNPWEICRPHLTQKVGLYGTVKTGINDKGNEYRYWEPAATVTGVPWDVPVIGYKSDTINILRLWQCRTEDHFDWDQFNAGRYHEAHRNKVLAETITKVLYPSDETAEGQELRFIQQYFFCACSIKDIIDRFVQSPHADWGELEKLTAIQLNDTHPTVAILELMRVLHDEIQLDWDDAWAKCQKIFSYTNHTLLPEALESWSVALFERVLPRHLEILYRINKEFLDTVVDKKWPGDVEKRSKLSLIQENGGRAVRMANLCVITSHRVNGVAAIHSELVKKDLFPEFNELFPGRLINVTNGITPRRWLLSCNPELAKLLNNTVGDDWPKDLYLLEKLQAVADDRDFHRKFMAIKFHNKQRLARFIKEQVGVKVDPTAIFDVHIKRLHEYKRQHLNLLHILSLYRRLLNNPDDDMHPRVFIFSAKAAPSYYIAKEIIYAINRVAERINNDLRIQGKLKVVFLPNYRVSTAEKIIPAADVSEQISTAGKEASGTGNMKLALNGAVTIGTMDGANIEIAECVGDDNIFIFGKTVDEMKELNAKGYQPADYFNSDSDLKACLDWLESDYFTPGNPGELSALRSNLIDHDPYRVLVDFASYKEAHNRLDEAYKDTERWAKMAIINTAMMGKFNSDRAIQAYVDRIWKLEPSKE
jgi:starch phosphorylase